MTFEKIIEEGIDKKVCIMGNIDARYTMTGGTKKDVEKEVTGCLKLGQKSPGGHILHLSHSVHEHVKIKNYYAMVNAYRKFFGLDPL